MKKLLYTLILTTIPLLFTAQSLNINRLGGWHDVTIGTNNNNQTYNDCWGWAQNGREYAVIGSMYGSHIIDVTNPANPVEVDRIPGRQQGGSVVHRDFKVHKGHLYMVGDQGNASLQIADLSYLPDSVHLVYDQDTIVKRSHNIFIDTANDRLYSCGGNTLAGGRDLMILDISTPAVPTLLVDLKDDVTWWGNAVGYVHDIYVKNNIGYTHDDDAMHIIDFTNPTAPVILGTLNSYVDQGYNHSGWLHNDDSTYVLLDETHDKGIKILDVSTPNNITVTDLVEARPDSNIIVHNGFIHGDLLYISYYYDGVYVYDVSDRNNVTLTGYYDTYQGPNGQGYHGCWGVYPYLPSGNILASDLESGLYVLGFDKPAVNFETQTATMMEGDAAQTIEISIAHGTSVPVSVDIALASGASITPGVDFNVTGGVPQTITFPANTTKNQSITISVVDDAALEGTETGSLELQAPVNGVIGVNNMLMLTINDNEFASISEIEEHTLNLLPYPNPIVKGEVLTFNKTISFKIYDVLGNLVATKSKREIFNTSNLKSGAYIIKTQTEQTRIVVY